MRSRPRILFRVSAGPRIGYGHAVRATRLASVLRADAMISVRGGRRLAGPAVPMRQVASTVSVLDLERVDLLILDTPNVRDAGRWLAAARRRGIPVTSVHDRGLASVASDLVVDGSLLGTATHTAGRTMIGPRFAILDSRLAAASHRPPRGRAVVFVAFGGGSRRGAALRAARAIATRRPGVKVVVAGGLSGQEPATRRLDGIRWLGPQDGLSRQLARAHVAVVAGGMTLFEAAVIGVPTVAVAVVQAQRPTVAAFARRGAVRDPRVTLGGGRRLDRRSAGRIAAAVEQLLDDAGRGRRMAARARRLVDGRGTGRVARAIGALLAGRRVS